MFAVLYLTADTDAGHYTAAAVIGLSGFTDLFDGKIARRFNMVTELGKFLDPVADKLTLGVIALCMSSRYPLMWSLTVLLIVKEGFMAVAGAVMLRHNGRKLNGAAFAFAVSFCGYGQRPDPFLYGGNVIYSLQLFSCFLSDVEASRRLFQAFLLNLCTSH